MGHTIDETSGSSGFGFSIRSYIAMITDCQPYALEISCYPSPFALAPVTRIEDGEEEMDIPWFIFELGFH